MKIQRTGKILFICMLMFAVLLTGCRVSPVLEQIVYEDHNEVDPENHSIENEEDNEERDEDIAPVENEDDLDRQEELARQDAVSGDEDQQADKTSQYTYDSNGDSEGSAGQSPSESNDGEGNGVLGNTNGQEVSDNIEGTIPGGEGDEDSSGEEEEDDGGNGNEDDPPQSGVSQENPSQEETTKQVVDARDEYVEVPAKVGPVTATGEIATIVEMLGGSNRLLASSASFTGNSMAQSVFAYQGISNVNTWWSGDGSATISSGNFNALVSAKPDVCFEISGQNTFSSDQVTAMKEAGIAYVVLPELSSLSNIKEAVRIVGDCLGDTSANGGSNAPQIAKQYGEWVDSLISTVQEKRGSGVTNRTIFVGWDDDAVLSYPGGSATGGAYSYATLFNDESTALYECITAANLIEQTCLDQGDRVFNGKGYIDPLYYAGSISYEGKYKASHLGTEEYSPVKGRYEAINVFVDDRNAEKWLWNHIGTIDTFNTMIAMDSYTAGKIAADPVFWPTRSVSYYVTPLGGSGKLPVTWSNASGNYWILINPSGVGSWTEGSAECILEAAWLCWKYGGISESEFKSYVSDFYSTFYQVQIDVDGLLMDDIYMQTVEFNDHYS